MASYTDIGLLEIFDCYFITWSGNMRYSNWPTHNTNFMYSYCNHNNLKHTAKVIKEWAPYWVVQSSPIGNDKEFRSGPKALVISRESHIWTLTWSFSPAVQTEESRNGQFSFRRSGKSEHSLFHKCHSWDKSTFESECLKYESQPRNGQAPVIIHLSNGSGYWSICLLECTTAHPF